MSLSDSQLLQPLPTPAVCVSRCLPVSPVDSQRLQLTKFTPQPNSQELRGRTATEVREMSRQVAVMKAERADFIRLTQSKAQEEVAEVKRSAEAETSALKDEVEALR